MIWDTLSPFYDLFERLYNGTVIRGTRAEVAAHVTAADEVLECACGTGLFSVPLAERCRFLTATDFSPGMLRQARRKLRKYPNVRVEQADLTALPYPDAAFDAVVAANVVHLLDDPAAALAELTRVCRPGGTLVIPTYINRQTAGATAAAKLMEKLGVRFRRQFDLSAYQKFFADLGFAGAACRVVEGRMPCAVAVIKNGGGAA